MELTSVSKTLAKLEPESRLLLAVSGGGDSLAMLYWFAQQDCWRNRIVAAHVNHGLNEESTAVERDVKRAADSLRIPFVSEIIDVNSALATHRDSIEACARRLRYAALERMCHQTQSDFIITAHTLDDDAETVYMKLRQSASWFEQTGIPRQRDKILRPFLDVRRSDLRAALPVTSHFHEDPMNSDPRFLRVQARFVLGAQSDPKSAELLSIHGRQTASVLELSARLTKNFNNNLLTYIPDPATLLESLPKNLYLEGLGFLWVEKALSNLLNDPEFRLPASKRRQVLAFLEGNPPQAKLPLPESYFLHRAGTKFWIGNTCSSESRIASSDLHNEIRTPFSYANQCVGQLDLNPASIRGNLVTRPWSHGERFRPYNRRTRKIADWLRDGGVHPGVRQHWPVLQDDEGIVAIPGLGTCQRAVAEPGTQNLLIRWKAEAPRADYLS